MTNEIPEKDLEKIQQLNLKVKLAVKDSLKAFLIQNNQSLMKILFHHFDEQKSDYANFGQESLLDILSEGNQVCCQGTLIQTGNKRLVLQSFLRLEEMPVSQQASIPVKE